MRLGLLLDNAETVDKQRKGETLVLTIQARGVTKNAAKRGAKKEASSLIPVVNQNFVNATKEKSSRGNQVWLFTVTDDGN